VRLLLTAYFPTRAAAQPLVPAWGGRIDPVSTRQWLAARPSPPLQIGKALRIVSEKPVGREKSGVPQLYIPHGLAFGSGEHATTSMLLRALTQHPDLARGPVLDLGTGSGVLALAARLLGARKIVATDWDAEAVRTARQNEALNFRELSIRWQRADVKRLRAKARYHLILANLFSGILVEAAAPIAAALAPGGNLWLSGILHSQQAEVIAAYEEQKLHLARTVRRGKWVMLCFR